MNNSTISKGKKTTLPAISTPIHAEIMKRLHRTEQKKNVRILYAVESGSRAWGFASPNSDYDVRFIYARPRDWYLSVDLEERRDVIEYPIVDEIDLNGWDVRKALRLFWKSNPALIEWLHSPIVYINKGCFADEARRIIPQIYRLHSGIYHYRSMAKSNFRSYLQQEMVPLKKYLYVLRPLLSVRWIEKHSEAAPIDFSNLLTFLENDSTLYKAIQKLLAQKRSAPETGMGQAVPEIHEFIEKELQRLENITLHTEYNPSQIDRLNQLFASVLAEQTEQNK